MDFPTPEHAAAAVLVAEYADRIGSVDTVLVVNSCARATAVPESDLDMAFLMSGPFDEAELEAQWRMYKSSRSALQIFCERSAFSAIHLDFFEGTFHTSQWDDGGGPDDFEIEIGNRVAHAVPFHKSGQRFSRMQQQWLPYYDAQLRDLRLQMVRDACRRDLDFIPFYLRRGLYLQAFDRLYKAFREYLQALFISHQVYPVAYNKWLEEQLGWVGRQNLLRQLLAVISVTDLGSAEVNTKAAVLRELVDDLVE